MPFGRNALVDVTVACALFERPLAPHFYARVRVANVAGRPVGIDLRGPFDVFYPNQWGTSSAPYRADVNERVLSPAPLDPAAQRRLLADHRAGSLTTVPTGEALDYYVEFNAGGRAEVEGAEREGLPYVLLIMDGRLLVTDGSIALQMTAPGGFGERDCAMAAPVVWRVVPAGAVVVDGR
jgi:hypothetical protein